MFGESPRWHDGRLWAVDFGAREVLAIDTDGNTEVITRIPDMPMGTGFAPDGRLLVVSVREGQLLAAEPGAPLAGFADLASLSSHPWGDMVVDGRGNAYVGNLGFDFPGGEFAPGILALVTPQGTVRQVADAMSFPNGMVVTPDNKTLIVAETYGHRLTAFDITPDGSLDGRRTWADLPGGFPDGICLDAEGAIWYADVPGKRCARVGEGGQVLQTIELDRGCFACTLGGPDRQTLFIMAAEYPPAGGERTGQVITVQAPAPGVGWP
jgi:sugar lactone lactonase YvrE